MGRIFKALAGVLFPQEEEEALRMGRKRRGKMTLFHVMALNNVAKASIRTLGYGVMGLKKGVRGYGNTLFQAKFRPGLFFMKNAQMLCREAARGLHFDILFIEPVKGADQVNVLCPQCNEYWTWQDTLENDLAQESGRLCAECRASSFDRNGFALIDRSTRDSINVEKAIGLDIHVRAGLLI